MFVHLYNSFYMICSGLISVWDFLNSPVEPISLNLGDNWLWDTLESIISFTSDVIVTFVNTIPTPNGEPITWLGFVLGYGVLTYISFVIITFFVSLFK